MAKNFVQKPCHFYCLEIKNFNFWNDNPQSKDYEFVRMAARFGIKIAIAKICHCTREDKIWQISEDDQKGLNELEVYAHYYGYYPAYETMSHALLKKKFGTETWSREARNSKGALFLKRYAKLDNKAGIPVLLEAYQYQYHGLTPKDPDYKKYKGLQQSLQSPAPCSTLYEKADWSCNPYRWWLLSDL